jgi:ADP-heptose:LPS heptosyltransferase
MSATPVLVFRIGSLGDTVVALPALREIRRRHPSQSVILLTNTPVDGGIKAASSTHVLAGMSLVDDSIEYPHGSRSVLRLWRVIRAIRTRRPRLCYFLVQGRSPAQRWRDRLFLHLAGIRRIVGLRPDEGRHRPPQGLSPLWESEALRTFRATGAAQRPLALADFSLELSQDERQYAARVLLEGGIRYGSGDNSSGENGGGDSSDSSSDKYIVLSIGSKLKVKDWGDERWMRCLRLLGAEDGSAALVSIGSADEAPRSATVLAVWPGLTLNLCGRLTPRQSAAVLEKAVMFLGHDSGPMHLASAVGTRTIAVFSARAMPGIWFPFGQESNVQQRNIVCSGCGLDECVEKRMLCMTQIDPEQVARVARLGIKAAQRA